MAPAVAMIVAVLAQGYVRWWFDTPWLAWLLVAGIVLLAVALFIEHHRRNPLFQTCWLVNGARARPDAASLFAVVLAGRVTPQASRPAAG